GADLDRLLGAVEIEPADVAEARADHDVGGVAGQARASDAILHDVVGFDHHGRQAWPPGAADELALEQSLGAGPPPAAILTQYLSCARNDRSAPAGKQADHGGIVKIVAERRPRLIRRRLAAAMAASGGRWRRPSPPRHNRHSRSARSAPSRRCRAGRP